MKATTGDWIRFMRDSRLVITEVGYVHTRFGWEYYVTDKGEVKEDAVLEVRERAAPAAKDGRT